MDVAGCQGPLVVLSGATDAVFPVYWRAPQTPEYIWQDEELVWRVSGALVAFFAAGCLSPAVLNAMLMKSS